MMHGSTNPHDGTLAHVVSSDGTRIACKRNAPRGIAAAAPLGRHLEFAGENHMVPPRVVAPELKAFFREVGGGA